MGMLIRAVLEFFGWWPPHWLVTSALALVCYVAVILEIMNGNVGMAIFGTAVGAYPACLAATDFRRRGMHVYRSGPGHQRRGL